VIAIVLVFRPATPWLFPIVIVLSLALRRAARLPIGGADMPTVISLLNRTPACPPSRWGSCCENKLLITAGALDGSSGLILSIIMCRAMNRSFTNVLFGAFGQVQAGGSGRAADREVGDAEDVSTCSTNAEHRRLHPGYGMAVPRRSTACATCAIS
jgi:NAD(P) transhydrogenase subunit beta